MRIRQLALGAAAIAAAVAPAAQAAASPAHAGASHRVTIHVQPNPDVTGDPAIIFGRLFGAGNGHRTVTLWHRLPGQPRFTPVQRVMTDANGFYDITRAEGVVTTNRGWFVRAGGVQSRVVRERVLAELTFVPSTVNALTNHPITFTGNVKPNHAGERVRLQEQVGDQRDDWRTIGSGRIGPGSNYTIKHNFRVPGTHTLRALFAGDARNVRSVSSPVDVGVQQTQNPKLTLNPSANPLTDGQSLTLSGMLAAPGNGGQQVVLFGHEAGKPYAQIATTTTDMNGNYSFTLPQQPIHNTVYQVKAGARKSAQVFEAVKDVVTLSPVPANATTGQTVSFTGSVSPNKAGHSIELQRLGDDGDYHTVQQSVVAGDSSYRIDHVLGSPGVKTFRVLITGGPVNAGGHSDPVKITVAPPPPTA